VQSLNGIGGEGVNIKQRIFQELMRQITALLVDREWQSVN